MAVKVMVAPVTRKAEPEKSTPRRTTPPREASPRPKRRRSSVYDADGNEVFITLICLKCQKIKPLSQFGLRRMADGAIRNQPWCRDCRSGTSAHAEQEPKGRRKGSSVSVESPAVVEPPAPVAAEPVERPRPRSVAAEVAAALAAGRG